MRTTSPSLELYLQEIRRIPLLTPEEELALAQKCQQGDADAEVALVRANLRFVVSVALEFTWSNIPLEDLINAGNIGLIEATRKFDPSLGNKLISYAVWVIRKYIRMEIAALQNIITSNTSRIQEHGKIRQTFDQAETEQLAEAPAHTNLEDDGYAIAKRIEAIASRSYVSLDAPLSTGANLHDVLHNDQSTAPDAHIQLEYTNGVLQELLAGLNAEEAVVISYMHGLDDGYPHTIVEAVAYLNLTETVVLTRHDTGLRKMRAMAKTIRKRDGHAPFEP